jgi:phage-related protein
MAILMQQIYLHLGILGTKSTSHPIKASQLSSHCWYLSCLELDHYKAQQIVLMPVHWRNRVSSLLTSLSSNFVQYSVSACSASNRVLRLNSIWLPTCCNETKQCDVNEGGKYVSKTEKLWHGTFVSGRNANPNIISHQALTSTQIGHFISNHGSTRIIVRGLHWRRPKQITKQTNNNNTQIISVATQKPLTNKTVKSPCVFLITET